MASAYVGIDLHRRRSVIVRQTPDGQVVDSVRIDNDPVALGCAVAEAGPDPEVVIEATYGWYWAVDVLTACGATVHLAHPLGVKAFAYRRVKNEFQQAYRRWRPMVERSIAWLMRDGHPRCHYRGIETQPARVEPPRGCSQPPTATHARARLQPRLEDRLTAAQVGPG